VLEIFLIGIGDMGFTGDDDLSLDVRESLGDNGVRHRFLVFACDSHKRFVLLVHAGIEVFGPSQIFSWVSPDIQGFL
jgi:hypothetical protein